MTLTNSKRDIENLPDEVRIAFLARLAATIYSTDADGNVLTNTADIEHFGFTLADFPDAPVIPYQPPVEHPRAIPATIRAWQAKAILKMQGMLESAEAVIAALPEPQKTVVESAWNNQADFSRDAQTIVALAAALGLTEEQLDEMFAQAASLTV